ncbi:MAG: hypothetical protein AAFY41_00510 [Bacteroidota bacterium]
MYSNGSAHYDGLAHVISNILAKQQNWQPPPQQWPTPSQALGFQDLQPVIGALQNQLQQMQTMQAIQNSSTSYPSGYPQAPPVVQNWASQRVEAAQKNIYTRNTPQRVVDLGTEIRRNIVDCLTGSPDKQTSYERYVKDVEKYHTRQHDAAIETKTESIVDEHSRAEALNKIQSLFENWPEGETIRKIDRFQLEKTEGGDFKIIEADKPIYLATDIGNEVKVVLPLPENDRFTGKLKIMHRYISQALETENRRQALYQTVSDIGRPIVAGVERIGVAKAKQRYSHQRSQSHL